MQTGASQREFLGGQRRLVDRLQEGSCYPTPPPKQAPCHGHMRAKSDFGSVGLPTLGLGLRVLGFRV